MSKRVAPNSGIQHWITQSMYNIAVLQPMPRINQQFCSPIPFFHPMMVLQFHRYGRIIAQF